MTPRPRRLRWGVPETPSSRHPYRDTFAVYGVLAVLVVVFAWATGGDVVRAVIIAAVVFVLASAWSLWRQFDRRRAAGEEVERS